MANANPTVFEVTQQASPNLATVTTATIQRDNALFIWSISGIDGHFAHPGPDWIFEINGRKIDATDTAADTVRLSPNDQLTWKLI